MERDGGRMRVKMEKMEKGSESGVRNRGMIMEG